MAAKAIRFIACNGPVTGQDRWKENSGLNAFSLAVAIAALVEGAAFLPASAQSWALDLADFWNASIESWLTVSATDLAARVGVSGYYVRIAPPDVLSKGQAAMREPIPIRNHNDQTAIMACELIGTDFLQLVRFGLRQPDDPLIRDSIIVADSLLKVDTPHGPVWRRYSGDGYGEHDDGTAYDGTGRGRPWPLLTGERGHYELAAGQDPLPYLAAICGMASSLCLIPEQVWDGPDIPARELFFGRPSGSARPLAWAHAEFAKLVISRQLGWPCDRPGAVWQRYHGHRPVARRAFWSPKAPIGETPPGSRLVVALPRPATVRWTCADRPEAEVMTEETGLGFHAAELDTSDLPVGCQIAFGWTWREGDGATNDPTRLVVGAKATEVEQ